MARRRRKRQAKRQDTSLLTIVLAVGAVLLLSNGGLTGFQVRDELATIKTIGPHAGSQLRADQICDASAVGAGVVYSGADKVLSGQLYQGRVSTIIVKCINGDVFVEVCPDTKAALGTRKIVAPDRTITSTYDPATTGLHCITHDERAFLNSAGLAPGSVVQPRGPSLSGPSL